MARAFLRLGRLIIVSRRHKRIRSTLIFLFGNFFLLASIVLTFEILLTTLGVSNLFLPLPQRVWDLISRLVL